MSLQCLLLVSDQAQSRDGRTHACKRARSLIGFLMTATNPCLWTCGGHRGRERGLEKSFVQKQAGFPVWREESRLAELLEAHEGYREKSTSPRSGAQTNWPDRPNSANGRHCHQRRRENDRVPLCVSVGRLPASGAPPLRYPLLPERNATGIGGARGQRAAAHAAR